MSSQQGGQGVHGALRRLTPEGFWEEGVGSLGCQQLPFQTPGVSGPWLPLLMMLSARPLRG